jgi:hypothetical protein
MYIGVQHVHYGGREHLNCTLVYELVLVSVAQCYSLPFETRDAVDKRLQCLLKLPRCVFK